MADVAQSAEQFCLGITLASLGPLVEAYRLPIDWLRVRVPSSAPTLALVAQSSPFGGAHHEIRNVERGCRLSPSRYPAPGPVRRRPREPAHLALSCRRTTTATTKRDGEIGRRAGSPLTNPCPILGPTCRVNAGDRCRKACGFESHSRYQALTTPRHDGGIPPGSRAAARVSVGSPRRGAPAHQGKPPSLTA